MRCHHPIVTVSSAFAAAAFGLLAAGCGGGPAAPGIASLASSTTLATTTTESGSGPSTGKLFGGPGGAPRGQFQIAMRVDSVAGPKFSACMRKHGVPSFPDPNSQGVISIHSGMGIDPGSPGFVSARSVCNKLLPNGGQPTPAQLAKAATADARLLVMHARARAQGLPRPVERGPSAQRRSRGAISTRATRRSRRHSRPARGICRSSRRAGRHRAARKVAERMRSFADAAALRLPALHRRRLSRRGRRLAAAARGRCWSSSERCWQWRSPVGRRHRLRTDPATTRPGVSLAAVNREDLSQQTQVSATLGYAGASVDLGARWDRRLRTSQQAAAGGVVGASAAASGGRVARDRQASARSGDGDACGRPRASSPSTAPAATPRRALERRRGWQAPARRHARPIRQAASTDDQSRSRRRQAKVAADRARGLLRPPRRSLQPEQRLAAAQVVGVRRRPDARSTRRFPQVGEIVASWSEALRDQRRARCCCSSAGCAPWRAFLPGMTAGADVAELNANLHALGYGDVSATHSRRQTRAAISASKPPTAAPGPVSSCSARSFSSRAPCA